MRIFINQIFNQNIVFSTDFGKAKGIWKADNRPVQQEYHVELDVDGIYRFENVSASDIEDYRIDVVAGKNYLIALLLEYDEDGCASLQMGDSIIEIETYFDERFYSLLNTYIVLCIENMNVYDENL